MKPSEVTVEALKKMGYKAMTSLTTWNGYSERECSEKQSEELFLAVVKAVQNREKFVIRRNHVRGTVIAHIDGTFHSYKGTETYYFLQRQMTDAEIVEESIRSGLWVNRR